MTPPDRLVQAAAEAICRSTHRAMPCVKCKNEARRALAAAFAALPGCEDVIMAVAEATPHGWTDDYGMRHSVVSKGNYDDAKAYIAALAREFGEGT